MFFEFSSNSKEKILYKFIISKNDITLLKNGTVLSSEAIKYDSKKTKLYRHTNEWVVELDSKKILEFRDETDSSSWNMTIGYSGIGKGQIFLNQIIIEDQL